MEGAGAYGGAIVEGRGGWDGRVQVQELTGSGTVGKTFLL